MIGGFAIQLPDGRLYKELGASDASVFSSKENAERTLSYATSEMVRQGRILRLLSGPCADEGASKIGGYWTVPA